MKQLMIAGLLAGLVATSPVLAKDDHDDHREHDSHTHGLAHLNIALEGDELHMELDSPAANIVGFEHMPSSAQDKETVRIALESLQQASLHFEMNAEAGCKAGEVHVDSVLKAQGQQHQDDHKHEHEHEDEHKDEHSQSEHSDVEAEYHFHCSNLAKLKRIHVRLFEHFPRTETIKVQFIGDRGQQAASLTKASPVFKLR